MDHAINTDSQNYNIVMLIQSSLSRSYSLSVSLSLSHTHAHTHTSSYSYSLSQSHTSYPKHPSLPLTLSHSHSSLQQIHQIVFALILLKVSLVRGAEHVNTLMTLWNIYQEKYLISDHFAINMLLLVNVKMV